MSHTPGPWRVMPTLNTWIEAANDPYGHGAMHIADVRGWGHLTGSGVCSLSGAAAEAIQDANARLIAAAPDLLAALKAIASISYDRFDCQEGDVSEHVEIAKAAIAKAEGSQP